MTGSSSLNVSDDYYLKQMRRMLAILSYLIFLKHTSSTNDCSTIIVISFAIYATKCTPYTIIYVHYLSFTIENYHTERTSREIITIYTDKFSLTKLLSYSGKSSLSDSRSAENPAFVCTYRSSFLCYHHKKKRKKTKNETPPPRERDLPFRGFREVIFVAISLDHRGNTARCSLHTVVSRGGRARGMRDHGNRARLGIRRLIDRRQVSSGLSDCITRAEIFRTAASKSPAVGCPLSSLSF